MGKKIWISLGIVGAVGLLSNSTISNAVLNFFLAGTLPGLSVRLPFWLMLVVYIALITVVSVAYIESTDSYKNAQLNAARKKQLPKRRFSSLPSKSTAGNTDSAHSCISWSMNWSLSLADAASRDNAFINPGS